MLSKWVKRFIYTIAFVAIAIVLLFNIIYINNIDKTEYSSIQVYPIIYLIASIIIGIGIAFFSYWIEKIKVSPKIKIASVIILLLLYALVQFLWIKNSIALPTADSEQVLIIAKGFLGKGELIPYCYMYLQYYPQQLTLTAVITFIFKILNSVEFNILQYINLISNIFIVLGLYAIVKNYSKKIQINKVLFWLITLTFIPIILLVTFVYGDLLGLAFSIWATYFAIKYTQTRKKRYILLSGILQLIACLVRMNYFIFAIAIVLYWLIDLLELKEKNIKQIVTFIGLIIVFIAIIFFPNSLIKNIYKQKYNLNTQRAFSTTPYIYMGVSEGDRGYGWYNSEIGDLVNHIMSGEPQEADMLKEQCNTKLKERLKYLVKNPIYTAKFYSKKIVSMWAEPTMEFSFYNSSYPTETNLDEYPLVKEILTGRTYKGIQIYQKGLTILILIGAIATIISQRKQLDKDIMLLCLIFLGGFSFHLLWEAKSRYIMPYVIILIPVACYGITIITNKIVQKMKNINNNSKKEGI